MTGRTPGMVSEMLFRVNAMFSGLGLPDFLVPHFSG